MNRRWAIEPLLASLCLTTAGLGVSACALLNKSEVVRVRYFSPEDVSPAKPAQSSASRMGMRLGRVSSGSDLRERIAYRADSYETGYYDNLRWTERPETYLRRALARTLFETHGFQGLLGGSAPTLDAELLAFEEVQHSAQRAGRVRLRITLHHDRRVLIEQTLDFQQTAAGTRFEDVVAALAKALNAAAESTAQRVEVALSKEVPVSDLAPASSAGSSVP